MRQGGSTRAWRKLRAFVLARDGYLCQRPDPHDCQGVATDAGHIVARMNGGRDTPENLRAECARGNRSEGARLRNAARAAPRVTWRGRL